MTVAFQYVLSGLLITGGGPTEYIIICVTWNTQYGGWCVADIG